MNNLKSKMIKVIYDYEDIEVALTELDVIGGMYLQNAVHIKSYQLLITEIGATVIFYLQEL